MKELQRNSITYNLTEKRVTFFNNYIGQFQDEWQISHKFCFMNMQVFLSETALIDLSTYVILKHKIGVPKEYRDWKSRAGMSSRAPYIFNSLKLCRSNLNLVYQDLFSVLIVGPVKTCEHIKLCCSSM